MIDVVGPQAQGIGQGKDAGDRPSAGTENPADRQPQKDRGRRLRENRKKLLDDFGPGRYRRYRSHTNLPNSDLNNLSSEGWYGFDYRQPISSLTAFKICESPLMSNMGKIVSGLIDKDVANSIRGVLINSKMSGYPKLVIQLPLPNEVPVPRLPLISTGLRFKIGKKEIPIVLEVGGSFKWKGRVLGFAVTNGPDAGNIFQFLRQDFGHDHGGWNNKKWKDPAADYQLHYHIVDS
jgi:hypothetical protein